MQRSIRVGQYKSFRGCDIIPRSLWEPVKRLTRYVLKLASKLFRFKVTDDIQHVWDQFVKFAFIGLSNALITLTFYYVIILVFGNGAYLIGQTIGYIAGIINSFFWNSRFVFLEHKQGKIHSFLKMTLCYALTYGIQIGLLYLFVNVCGISAFLSPVLAILISTPINFFLNKLWAFSEK